jgi:flagellar hook-associated protein 1
MSGLFSILGFTRQSMQVQQAAMETVKNNIANVNTPGYSRLRARLVENAPTREGRLIFGQGASINEVQALRDKFIEIRLGQEQKKSGYYSDLSTGLQQLEEIFNESGGSGLQNSLTEFFGSLLQLSSDPASIPLRQNVLLKAETLTVSIRTKALSVQELKEQANGRIEYLSGEANRLMGEIDTLNRQIVQTEAGSVDSGGLRDSRNVAVQELAKLMDVSYYEAPNGSLMVTTGKGRVLVSETGTHSLSTTISSTSGLTRVLLDGEDFTDELISSESGSIGAQLDFQGNTLADVSSRLDLLVQDLRDRFNVVHAQGFDLQGNAGLDFFVPASGAITAMTIRVGIRDPNLIAAAGVGAVAGTSAGPGDNTNIRALYDMSKALPNTIPIPADLTGLTYGDFLLQLTTDIASQTSNASDSLESQSAVLLQLQRQRESVSGVSLDEEATDVIRYQKAFEASSRFFSVISQLTEEVLRLAG